MDLKQPRTRAIGLLTRAAHQPWRGRIALALAVVLLLPLVAFVGQTTAATVDDDPAPNCARPYDLSDSWLPGNDTSLDPAHTGRLHIPDAIGRPRLVWQEPAYYEDWQVQSPGLSADNDGLYLLSGGFTTSLDKESGRPRWFYDSDLLGQMRFQPAVTLQMVVTVAHEALTAVDHNGKQLWTTEAPTVSGFSSPVVAGGVFTYDAKHQRLLGFDLTDGRLCWTVEGSGGSHWGWSPSTSEGAVFAVLGGALVAVDAETGSERWRFQPEDDPSLAADWPNDRDGLYRLRAPAIAGNRVYLMSPAGNLYAVDRLTGNLIWQVAIGTPDGGPVIGYDDLVYVTSDRATNPTLLAIDRRSGEVRWSRPYAGEPVLVDWRTDAMLLVADAGSLRAVDVESGADRWSYPLEGEWFTQPAVEYELVYIANDQGTVFALIDANGQPVPPAGTPAATPAA